MITKFLRAATALTVLASGAVPVPALAGWLYADWGMTPDEVVAASGGAVHLQTGKLKKSDHRFYGDLKALGEWVFKEQDTNLGSYSFPMRFYFAPDGLAEVEILQPDNARFDCDRMREALVRTYGNPRGQKVTSEIFFTTDWRIPEQNTVVFLSVTRINGKPPTCSFQVIRLDRLPPPR